MSTERWVNGAGVGLTWATLFNAADLNSLANGSSVMSSITPIANGGSILDVFSDWSVQLGSITAAAPNYLGLYLYPLNSDGSTYGDNQFVAGTQAAKVPSANYWVQNIGFPTGAAAIKGTASRIIMLPGTWLPVLYNQAGAAIASSGNVGQYRTYNRQVT